jgi:serine/threonine-protein kinase HipA
MQFGSKVCGVVRPGPVLQRIAQAMQETLDDAKGDSRIPADLLARMEPIWQVGMAYAPKA